LAKRISSDGLTTGFATSRELAISNTQKTLLQGATVNITRTLSCLAQALLVGAAYACGGSSVPEEMTVSSPPRLAGEAIRAAVPGLPTTSDRWSGYAVTGSNYTSMQGSWNMPSVSYAPGGSGGGAEQTSSTWIGIGGNGPNDDTLVQLGTLQQVNSSGGTKYYAWYLFYGGLGMGITELDPATYPIQPGDTVTATINCTANCTPGVKQTWQLSMSSPRWAHSWQSQPVQYQDSLASTEWIMEAATVGGVISDMPNFTRVNFSNARVNGSVPSFTSSEAIGLSQNGKPVAEALPPSGPGAFSVTRIGLPVNVPLPTSFVPNKCPAAAMLGELTPASMPFGGSLAPGQAVYQQFYTTKYAQLGVNAPPQPHRPYAIEIVDDLTGNSALADYSQSGSLFFLSIDPGYYCLRIRNLMPQPTPYNFQLSTIPAGYFTTPTMAGAQLVTLMDLGNLSNNLYYKPRFIWMQQHPGPGDLPPLNLTAGHVYTLRDWVGVAAPDQWYRFSIDVPRSVQIAFTNLYLGATVSVVDTAGNVIGASAYENASMLGSIIPNQDYQGSLPAGTYYLHISFSGTGAPGTRFTLELTAQ
jgi:hypothetical protein